MNTSLEFSSYLFEGCDELCIKSGTRHSAQILLIPPLFDEMNRMRRMLADVMRLLDEKGAGSILPDVPGFNESVYPQKAASLSIWKRALAHCLADNDECTHIASFRGGALIDDIDESRPRWRLAPARGPSILRTMMRTRIAADKEAGKITTMAELKEVARSEPINLAGNQIGPSMFAELEQAEPSPAPSLRLARLQSDSKPADVKLAGSALWLRAEPDDDLTLSSAIADDLAAWIKT